MCGIAGFVQKNSEIEQDDKKIYKMTDAIVHRGPDAEGQFIEGNLALGHRRLSIIDLDERSSQPLESTDGRYLISFNGEIYNYIELREELERKGSKFHTNSDTEVVIEAYRYYGEKCLTLLNGMWAFCIYDRENHSLFISRDRFGIKPLYTLDNDEIFSFCSEIKGIIAAFPEENIPNELMLYRYLTSSLNENVDEETYYKNVKIFPAAHYMIYELQTGKKTMQEYWRVNEQEFYDKWIKGKNPISTFKSLFDSAIQLRLRADVEVGACLSGGLDSSAIVGCAAKKYGKKLHTFSSIYQDKTCNEEEYIKAVNAQWNTYSHYIKPDDEEKEFTKHIEKIIYHHDGPPWGASLYSQYMVMKGVNEYVKVVLDGQGADELFAGYIPYYTQYISDLMNKGGLYYRLKAIQLLTIVNKEWPEIIGSISTCQIIQLVGVENSFKFQNKEKATSDKLRRSVVPFTAEFTKEIKEHYKRKDVLCSSNLNTRLCNDVINRSIPALLHNEDSNSMAFSIESRVPFLDYRIVEFAIALDGKYKLRNQWTKWIVRKSLKSYLPEKIVKRKNKMGFPAPFARWLRAGESKEDLKRVIYAFAERNIVPKETIDIYYKSHISGEADLSNILFKYYSAELWLRTCLVR